MALDSCRGEDCWSVSCRDTDLAPPSQALHYVVPALAVAPLAEPAARAFRQVCACGGVHLRDGALVEGIVVALVGQVRPTQGSAATAAAATSSRCSPCAIAGHRAQSTCHYTASIDATQSRPRCTCSASTR